MTKTIQLLRGTTAQNDAFTGAAGELTVDTTTNELRVHDGSTAGGHIIYTKSDVDTALSGKANTTTTYTKTEVDNIASGKANVALDNLSSVGQNIGNWSSNVTNCITYIPQDIKLELNNGTLTLKAGSKVRVPNGVGVFDEVVIANDLSYTGSWGTNEQMCVSVYGDGSIIALTPVNRCTSGTTAPTQTNYRWWYDTSTNLVKEYSGGSYTGNKLSFPIAIVTALGDGTSTISSIDQVFNGFGYIGSTVFALPGVKGLIPDGRHYNGTLYNNEFTINEVHTATFSGTTNYTTLVLSASGWIGESNNYSYAEDINYNIWGGNKSDVQHIVLFGNCKLTSGVISYFNIKTAFHAVDYSDTEYIAHQAMPSGRGIDLTLGASGASYTAPADGYIYLNKTASAVNQIITIINDSNGMRVSDTSVTANGWIATCLPVSKGQSIRITYTAGGTTNAFQFIYANGAA